MKKSDEIPKHPSFHSKFENQSVQTLEIRESIETLLDEIGKVISVHSSPVERFITKCEYLL